MQWPHGYIHDDRAAVGVGDNPVVLVNLLGIHFRHDQRNALFHAKRRRVVDDDRTGLYGAWSEFLADASAGREECDLNILETIVRELFDGVRLSRERRRLSGAARRGE